MAQSFDAWLDGLGPLTKCGLALAVLLTTLVSLQVVPLVDLLLSPAAFTRLQLWRPVSAAFFFGGFSFPWLLSLAMFVSYMNYNESFDFKGQSGDFLWMGIVLVLGNTAGGLLLGLPVTSFAMLMSLCWVFCKRHPELRMNLFSFEFNAGTFPWILLLFHLITGHSILEDLVGIVVGHLFFFLRDILPKTDGADPLRTPAWFLRYVLPNSGRPGFGTVHPVTVTAAARQASGARLAQQRRGDGGAAAPHQWGAGRALGAD